MPNVLLIELSRNRSEGYPVSKDSNSLCQFPKSQNLILILYKKHDAEKTTKRLPQNYVSYFERLWKLIF